MRSERPLLKLTPRVRRKSWQDYIIVPLVRVLVGLFSLAYKLFFGWWLNPILDKYFEKKFREQVATELAFLFQNFNGRFVPNQCADKYSVRVTIEAADLRIVVGQHHGDYWISVASRSNPVEGESLESILEIIYEREGSHRKARHINLAELGELFREKFDEVQIALSKEHYPDTSALIDRNHQSGTQKMVRTFNRPDSLFEAELINPNDVKKKTP